MKTFLLSFFLSCFFSLANGNPPVDFYRIDASQRGQEFVKTLDVAFGLAGTSGEVVIQTMSTPPFRYAPGLINGVIPFVQRATFLAAPNSTLFIVPYNPNGSSGITRNTQYLVVAIEDIVTIAARPTISPPFPLTGFTSTYVGNVWPFYTISPSLRAQDIQSITNTFITSPASYNGSTTVSQVWILTNLNGPYYVPFNRDAPGLIPNVTAISIIQGGEFLLITYKPNSSGVSGTVIVAAEQVQQIIFYATNPPSS